MNKIIQRLQRKQRKRFLILSHFHYFGGRGTQKSPRCCVASVVFVLLEIPWGSILGLNNDNNDNNVTTLPFLCTPTAESLSFLKKSKTDSLFAL